jgi:hypothetical protein
MKQIFLSLFFCIPCWPGAQTHEQAEPMLKYLIYDFDGLNTGQTNLPDGEFKNGDLEHFVEPNPLAASAVLGDRVLRLELTWQNGGGEFGKALMRFIDLNAGADYFSFYIYSPLSNSGDADIRLLIAEDDNGNDLFEDGSDDKWAISVKVPRAPSWQLVTLPLSSFADYNSGGNGAFDAGYSGNGGMLFSVGLLFLKPGGDSAHDTYYIDMLAFSDGALPTGSDALDLPPSYPGARSALGALTGQTDASKTPDEFESALPGGKKISLVNWFMFYSTSGTTANMLPGDEVQSLIDRGYTPVITWEMMYQEYPRLHAVQPNFDQLLSGKFDGYIDAFAAKVKSYSGAVVMRIFHEFEGDWYCWSLTNNGRDPGKYIAAFRHVVNRFRAEGAGNAKWMWCLNAEPKPYLRYNNIMSCYPGDNYVDIVATDIYNHPDLGTPDWKSFRYTMAESYYSLAKYFAHKPLYVCEVGCRERYPGEPSASQTKGGWLCQMNADLQAYFGKVEAVVFFSMQKEHDWRVQSSQPAHDAFVNCIWNDSYYGGAAAIASSAANEGIEFSAYPNPFNDVVTLVQGAGSEPEAIPELRVLDASGKTVYYIRGKSIPGRLDLVFLSNGVYILEYRRGSEVKRHKVVRL